MITHGPTQEQFNTYQAMYDFFNRELFDGELPRVLLNFSRRAHSVGFFAPERWDNGAVVTHEISLNPSYLKDRDPIEVAATLVHEMVHLWQQERGTPSRTGYHNAQWAERMEQVGLCPSETGAPGGRKVGPRVSHYIVDGGAFARAFQRMPLELRLPWRCQAESDGGNGGKSRNKVKYGCAGCGANVWGRSGLSLLCGSCATSFQEL